MVPITASPGMGSRAAPNTIKTAPMKTKGGKPPELALNNPLTSSTTLLIFFSSFLFISITPYAYLNMVVTFFKEYFRITNGPWDWKNCLCFVGSTLLLILISYQVIQLSQYLGKVDSIGFFILFLGVWCGWFVFP